MVAKEELIPPKEENEKELTIEEKFEKYRKAGKIWAEVKDKILPFIVPGAKLLDICEKAEELIIEAGGFHAFPCNVSINNIAAHYTATADDQTTIQEGDLVKIDIGVHIDGFIADAAFSVCLNPDHETLIEAVEEALKATVEALKPDAKTNEIGEIIEKTIKKYGYRPIRDLTGHTLERYEIHGSKHIPNIKIPIGHTVEEGEAYGLDVFATTGSGKSHEDKTKCQIYTLLPMRVPLRFKSSKTLRRHINKNYKTLPFCERWLLKEFPASTVKIGMRELLSKGALYKYYVLVEDKGVLVSQAENTVIITKDGAEITTRL
ncbi:MAG: type II methionyl aminopeptidase [Candidatus Wukongarchaeota archaeon]|nr:type II methionyl aminopeptidase [Candidatus Wukongarchaeota archaeon]MDO8128112.1 type II methionyl aminopeptidase [Candidatus Wukongarchaeota archaeon]